MRKAIRLSISIFLLLSLYPDLSPAQTSQGNQELRIFGEEAKDSRVFYSVFVQSFYDSDGDGIGDIPGLTSKMGYLKELGIEGIWMLPVHPSPTYHKYDVEDYLDIHEDYGTLDDYRQLVQKAHELEMVVLLDLVVNHTSNRHPWFKKAASGNKKFRNYYVWSSDQPEIDKNPWQWHEVRDEEGNKLEGEKYYGLFWWEMPDLNFDEQKVRDEIIEIGKFWLGEVGVDGFRLDAAEHIYPPDEINKTLLWWKEFREAMEETNPEVIIVGEVWGGSDKTAPYLKSGFTSGFNFELADTIIQSLKKEEDRSIVETYMNISEKYRGINPDYEDATLLSKHDRNRILTELDRDMNKAKIGAALMLTLPGNPFIYYGEEIGMLGEKPDEFIREPFLWNIEGEDPGQTSWEIPYASSSRTVKPLIFQRDDRASMFNFYKNMIEVRKDNPALSKGSLRPLETGNNSVVSFFRFSENQEALILINLSSELQRIPTPWGLDGFETGFSNFNVFKINNEEISLQPYAIFVLIRESKALK